MIKLILVPIKQTAEENKEFIDHPDCKESIFISVNYYKKIGYDPPWIGYYAKIEDKLVGSAGFKGKPKMGKVEIAYGTFPKYRNQGIGTEICRQMVLLSLKTDPDIRITARTLPENKESAGILKRNGFELLGTVWDEEDGNVWEWEFNKINAPDII